MAIKYESGAEMWARLNCKVPLESPNFRFFPGSNFVPGKIYEICGFGNIGKSIVIYSILSKILSDKCDGGLAMGAIFIDNDMKFDVIKMTRFLENVCNRSGSDVELVVKRALRRLQYMTCEDSEDFLSTLSSIEEKMSLSSSKFPGKRKKLVDDLQIQEPIILVVDSISAFYAFDRYDEQKDEDDYEQLNRIHKMYAQRLKQIASNFNMIILTTQLTLELDVTENDQDSSKINQQFYSPMQYIWKEAMTQKLV
uniref:RecA family profile 1 domain-containing protein n=1 Tax=Romanomermis culicivorax TaxID=13658 RepID=A0A915K907_ROMCU